MSFSKAPYSPYASAIKEMNYWKSRAQSANRGDSDPWKYDSGRPYQSSAFDLEPEGSRWPSDRADVGARNDASFGSRMGSSNRVSSSSQINSNLFNNFQSRNILDRNNEQFSYRMGPQNNPGITRNNLVGRVTRNSLVDATRAKRILQKRALSAVGSGALNNTGIKRKRAPRKKSHASVKAAKREKEIQELNADMDMKTEDNPIRYEKVTPELRLAIIWVNDAKDNINVEQATLLTKKLEILLDELPVAEDGYIPKFYTSGLSAGIYKIACVDKKTADWLKETIENLPELWEGSKFNVIQQSDLNGLKHVSIILAHCETKIITILKRIEKQNPGLKTDKWRVHRETLEDYRRIIVFAIDGESLDYLKKHEWKVFSGLRQIKFTAGVARGNLALNKSSVV